MMVTTVEFGPKRSTKRKAAVTLAPVEVPQNRPVYVLTAIECGTSLCSQPDGMPGVTNIKTGSPLETNVPIAAELFVTRRRDYVTPVIGANQAPGLP
jgi:hypothetical protein